MYKRSYVTVFFIVLLHTFADASAEPTIPFVDGIWRGEVETGSNGSGFKECWASTTFGDGTTFTATDPAAIQGERYYRFMPIP